MKPFSKNVTAVAMLAAFISLLLYIPSIFSDFINWDDPLYIIDNPGIRILDWQFITEAFTTSYLGWWMPLTWISFAVDYHFWGLNPFGYHLTNVLLHAVNTGLVVLVADGVLRGSGVEATPLSPPLSGGRHFAPPLIRGGWEGLYPATLLLAALLWGLHPLRVESVAWVTERKDVLNGIFSLATVYFYLRYARLKDNARIPASVISNYILSLLFLLLSLMSKPVSVVIPAMLLLADWYPLQRFRKGKVLQIFLEKVPFLILVAAISIATVYFAAGNRILVSFDDFSMINRFLLAGNSLFEYCRLSLYPVNIIHLYLLPWPLPVSYTVKFLLVVLFSGFCVWQYRKSPWLAATWLAFILPLLPVLGFLQNGAQSHAARFTYLPAVVPSICAAALLMELYGRVVRKYFRFYRTLLAGIVIIPLLGYAAITERHLAAWKNPETLWSRAIEIKPVGRAYYLRGDYFLQKGRYLEAADDFQASINLGKKAGFNELYNLYALKGDALAKAGRYDEAVKAFTDAITLRPNPNYFYHRGLAEKALGNLKDAEADFLRGGNETGSIEWIGLK